MKPMEIVKKLAIRLSAIFILFLLKLMDVINISYSYLIFFGVGITIGQLLIWGVKGFLKVNPE